ncbi:MAG: hypothetical protein D6699_03325 [Aquificota bacterium]|nr:MAG: hypothetical protein D6699_03325 [Aquificota bacterium]
MKKGLFAFAMAIGGLLQSCGGGTGVSGDYPVFKTATLTGVKFFLPSSNTEINSLESDVLRRTTRQVTVLGPDSTGTNCNQQVNVELCVGADFSTDRVDVAFNLEPIKDAKGNPLTTPSPILIRSYTVSFGNMCVPGTYTYNITYTLTAGESKVPIDLVTLDMKQRMAAQGPYTYIHQGVCPNTINNVYRYDGVCSTTARIEFEAVELATGIVRRITTYLPVRFADFTNEGECRI